jgi:ABC-2 type transport system ATP-binding protein
MVVVEGLTKFYGARRAVHNLHFRLEKGEVVGLLGLNGSGKTTALRMLAGILLPTAGRVLIDGRDLVEEPLQVKGRIGFLPETPPLYGEMTVRSYLEFAGRLKGLASGEVKARLDDVARRTQIEEVCDEIVDRLSYGYRKRVGIAQALLHDPDLLLLDEPAAGLDPVQIIEMRQLLRALRGSHTVLISSHFLSEISQICDRLLVIQDGEIVGQGTETDLAQRLAGRFKVRIELRGAQDRVMPFLEGFDGVEAVTLERSYDGVHVCSLSLSRDVREDLCRGAVERGLGVLALMRTDLELEEVFVKLMEKGEGSS